MPMYNVKNYLLGIGTDYDGRWSGSSWIPFRAPVLKRFGSMKSWIKQKDECVRTKCSTYEIVNENRQWDYA